MKHEEVKGTTTTVSLDRKSARTSREIFPAGTENQRHIIETRDNEKCINHHHKSVIDHHLLCDDIIYCCFQMAIISPLQQPSMKLNHH